MAGKLFETSLRKLNGFTQEPFAKTLCPNSTDQGGTRVHTKSKLIAHRSSKCKNSGSELIFWEGVGVAFLQVLVSHEPQWVVISGRFQGQPRNDHPAILSG